MKSLILRLVGGSEMHETLERCSGSANEEMFRFPADGDDIAEVSCYPEPERRQVRQERPVNEERRRRAS
jgi:hypothetical protein